MKNIGELRWTLACQLLRMAFRVAPEGDARQELAQRVSDWADACLVEHDRRNGLPTFEEVRGILKP